jgi:hypothetical protein
MSGPPEALCNALMWYRDRAKYNRGWYPTGVSLIGKRDPPQLPNIFGSLGLLAH